MLTFTFGVKSLQSNAFTNKSVVESATVGKHNQKENRELPITFTCYKSSSETLKPSDNLSGNIYIMTFLIFIL